MADSARGKRGGGRDGGGRAVEPAPDAGAAAAGTAATTPSGARGQGNVTLRYLGRGAFSTRSTRTGRAYACAGSGAGLSVDPRDAESLLRTRLFTRA